MAVQLTVRNDFGTSNLDLPLVIDLGDDVTPEAERATAAAFIGIVRESSRNDSHLQPEEAQALQLHPTTENEEERTADLVAKR